MKTKFISTLSFVLIFIAAGMLFSNHYQKRSNELLTDEVSVADSATDNADLIYSKVDKHTPTDINDDHIVVRKISSNEQDNLAVSGGNIYFKHDKWEINSTEHIKIEEMAKAIKKLNDRVTKVVLEGFASKTGDTKRNAELGALRSQEVRKALIKEGIEDQKIEIRSIGDFHMYQFENVNKNRRVQIKLLITK